MEHFLGKGKIINVIRLFQFVEQLNVQRIFGIKARKRGVVGKCSTYAKLKATC